MRTFNRAAARLGFAIIGFALSGAAWAATPGTTRIAAFRVNQSAATAGPNLGQTIASDDAGNLTVVWMSGRRVLMRRFGPNGAALTGEIAVSTAVAPGLASLTNLLPLSSLTSERNPSVAVNRSTGDFVVAWVDDNGSVPLPTGNPLNLYDFVLARQFDRNGLPKGATVFVTSTQITTPDQPYVAMNRAGAFVVAWSDRRRLNNAGPYFLNLAWYGANGQKQGATQPPLQQRVFPPTLTGTGISADGHLMLTWRESGSPPAYANCLTPQGAASGAVPLPGGQAGQDENGSILAVYSGPGAYYLRTYDASCRQAVGDVALPGSAALHSLSSMAIDSLRNQLALFGTQSQLQPSGFYLTTGYLGLYALSGTAYGAAQQLADLAGSNFFGADTPLLAFDGQGSLWAAWHWSSESTGPSIKAGSYYGGVTAH